ncbi:MAG: Stp1/IreP family PP2C-type Ser/Thr phosphatase [Clostridia bacterium]|nr:Stp1/IreP family PP2C-type Ser/Thr phosphatase [Clostridia bacterium]
MRFFGKTDVGIVRKINQDSFDCRTVWGKEATLLVVCDGMGGHRAGEIASKKAVTSFVDKVVSFPCLSEEQFEQFSEIRHTLIVAAKTANNLLFRMSRDFDELSGMGTTLVAGLIYNNMLYVVNIGDSRLYVITQNGVRQITHDHSFVQYLIDYGKITPEEAKNYPRKNVITQAVGINENAEADFFCVDLAKHGSGFILLCTDGLSNYVEPKNMMDILYGDPQKSEKDTDLEEAAGKLIDIALNGGGADNVTAVLAQF